MQPMVTSALWVLVTFLGPTHLKGVAYTTQAMCQAALPAARARYVNATPLPRCIPLAFAPKKAHKLQVSSTPTYTVCLPGSKDSPGCVASQ